MGLHELSARRIQGGIPALNLAPHEIDLVSRHRMRRGGINVLSFNGLSALAHFLHDTLDLHGRIGLDDPPEILLEGIVRRGEVGADSWARGEFCIT